MARGSLHVEGQKYSLAEGFIGSWVSQLFDTPQSLGVHVFLDRQIRR